jgi:hypothetical protein
MHVRYDNTNHWWEYSNDLISYVRLEDNFLVDGYGEFKAASAPATPTAGRLRIYAKTISGITLPYIKDDAGVEYLIDLINSSTGVRRVNGPNGSYIEDGFLSEQVTLSTVSLITDSSTNLLPANSLIMAVMTYIRQTISGGGVTAYKIGDSSVDTLYEASAGNLSSGSTSVHGLAQFNTQLNAATRGPTRGAVAAKIRTTAIGGIPTQGQIFYVVAYRTFSPPTS